MLPHRIAALALLVVSAGAYAEETTDPAGPAPEDTGLVPITPVSEMPVTPLETAAELTPPDIDGYLDPSLSWTEFNNTGVDDQPTGFRFIAGFLLKAPEGSPWRIAPEVGYFRLGAAEEVTSILDTNPPIAGYDAEVRTTRRLDATSLDFGARAAWQHEHFSVFGRLGINAYNAARRTSVVSHYTPDIPDDPDRPVFDDKPPTQSRTSIGVAWYGSVGLGYSFGEIPTVYIEAGGREVVGTELTTVNVGVLLNF